MADNKKSINFIEALLNHHKVIELENHEDSGVKVSIHTYDVLECSEIEMQKEFESLENAEDKLDFFAIIVGVIIHDLSKGSIRKDGENLSHSQMMIKNPEYIGKECEKLLEEVEEEVGYKVKSSTIKGIIHIVLSHHGKWGKVQPGSKEAFIVHKADEYSAKYHRINPIGSDKILKLMCEGMSIEEVAQNLSCTPGVIKDRLKRSKDELNINNTKQLINYYKKNKKIPLGDQFFEKRLMETEKLINLVTKVGFNNLILRSKIIDFIKDDKVFEL